MEEFYLFEDVEEFKKMLKRKVENVAILMFGFDLAKMFEIKVLVINGMIEIYINDGLVLRLVDDKLYKRGSFYYLGQNLSIILFNRVWDYLEKNYTFTRGEEK